MSKKKKEKIVFDDVFLDAEERCLCLTNGERVIFKAYVDELITGWDTHIIYDPEYKGEIFYAWTSSKFVFYTDLYYNIKQGELIFLCRGNIVDKDKVFTLLEVAFPKIDFCFVGVDEICDKSAFEVIEKKDGYILKETIEIIPPPTENEDISDADVFIDEEVNEVFYVKNQMVIKKTKNVM